MKITLTFDQAAIEALLLAEAKRRLPQLEVKSAHLRVEHFTERNDNTDQVTAEVLVLTPKERPG